MKKKLAMLTAILLALMIPVSVFAGSLTFSTETLKGKEYTSSKMSGYKLTMINFWSETCYPCLKEMPALDKLYKNYTDLLVLGVWVGRDREQAKEYAADTLVTYPVLVCDKNLEKLTAGHDGVPFTYFFDQNGNPVGEPGGYLDTRSYDDWKALVDELMAQVGGTIPPDPEPEEKDPSRVAYIGLEYKLNFKKKTAEFIGVYKNDWEMKNIIIPDTIWIDRVEYKVTSIAKNACKGLRITKLTIGKNVSKIGASAFHNCKKLASITIKTTKLKASKVGANAFKNVKAKVKIKCPKTKKAAYKKILLKKGITKKAVFQ